VVSSSLATLHCINPDCPRPFPQQWGNNFCQSCGSPLKLQNRYIPLQRLGSGGFAAVFTVYDLQTKTERVLKLLIETMPKAAELFKQEAAVLASLRHPGVPRVDPDGYFQLTLHQPAAKTLCCLVMEKIDGQTLQDVLEQHPQGCPEAWVVDWLGQAVEVLRELHDRQIIHRDLKPTNFMLRQKTGRLVIIDFGGAKQMNTHLAPSSTRLVSPGYSPPEQMAGSMVGPSADFYALGRTAIHLLTGRYPPEMEDPRTGELQWRNYASVTPELADLLDQLTQNDVRRRPATANDVLARLLQISAKTQVFSPGNRLSPAMSRIVNTGLNQSFELFSSFGKGTARTALALYRATLWTIRACLDTTWEMSMGGISGGLAAAMGFFLAFVTPLGDQVAGLLAKVGMQLLPNLTLLPHAEVLLIAFAGLGTAYGLSIAGGFGQKRRQFVAGLVGIVAYELGWLGFLLAGEGSLAAGMVMMGAIGTVLVTLGLRLPSHHWVHAIVTGIGTAVTLGSLTSLNLLPASLFDILLLSLPSAVTPGWSVFLACVLFFATWGILQGFWLGVSYYIVVPILRHFGWEIQPPKQSP
jgi:hypothetical protein